MGSGPISRLCRVFPEIRTDVAARIDELEGHLLPELRPLARVAYNYRWAWVRGGSAVFASLDQHRWRLAEANPVRFLSELSRERQHAAAAQPAVVEAIDRLAAEVATSIAPARQNGEPAPPVAFFCAEFGVHASLPI